MIFNTNRTIQQIGHRANVEPFLLDFRSKTYCAQHRMCFAFVSFSMREMVSSYESGLFDMQILRCHYSQAGLL